MVSDNLTRALLRNGAFSINGIYVILVDFFFVTFFFFSPFATCLNYYRLFCGLLPATQMPLCFINQKLLKVLFEMI